MLGRQIKKCGHLRNNHCCCNAENISESNSSIDCLTEMNRNHTIFRTGGIIESNVFHSNYYEE